MGLAFGWVQIDTTGATKVFDDEFLALVAHGEVFGQVFNRINTLALKVAAFMWATEVFGQTVSVERDCILLRVPSH